MSTEKETNKGFSRSKDAGAEIARASDSLGKPRLRTNQTQAKCIKHTEKSLLGIVFATPVRARGNVWVELRVVADLGGITSL